MSKTAFGICILALLAATHAQAGNSAKDPLVDRIVEGLGGAKPVDSVMTLAVETDTRRFTPNGWIRTPTRSFVEFPSSFRHEIEVNGSTVAMTSSPDGAYLVSPKNVLPLSAEQRHNIEVTALRNPLVMIKGRRNPLVSFSSVPSPAGDSGVQLVDVFVGNEELRIAVERESGRIVRQEFETVGGAPERKGRMAVTYSDFRRTPEGLVLPFRSRGTFEGETAFETEVKSVRVNQPLPLETFVPQAPATAPKAKAR